jgi:hypothetical protein
LETIIPENILNLFESGDANIGDYFIRAHEYDDDRPTKIVYVLHGPIEFEDDKYFVDDYIILTGRDGMDGMDGKNIKTRQPHAPKKRKPKKRKPRKPQGYKKINLSPRTLFERRHFPQAYNPGHEPSQKLREQQQDKAPFTFQGGSLNNLEIIDLNSKSVTQLPINYKQQGGSQSRRIPIIYKH